MARVLIGLLVFGCDPAALDLLPTLLLWLWFWSVVHVAVHVQPRSWCSRVGELMMVDGVGVAVVLGQLCLLCIGGVLPGCLLCEGLQK